MAIGDLRPQVGRYMANLLILHQLGEAWLDTQDEPASARLAAKLTEMRENVAPVAPPPGFMRVVTAEGCEHTIMAKAIQDVSETRAAPGPAGQVSLRLKSGQFLTVLGPRWIIEEAMRYALTPPAVERIELVPLGGRAWAGRATEGGPGAWSNARVLE